MPDLPHLPLPEEDLKELQRFCLENADRGEILKESLARRGIPYRVISIGESRHIALPTPNATEMDRQYYRVTLISHYDRVHGSPGANDNAACIFQLMSHWEEIRRLGWRHRTQIIFTDREELTKNMRPTDQGSWFLARHLKRLNVRNLLFLVLDMCGIGNTPVWGRGLRKSGMRRNGDSIAGAYRVMENFLKNYSNGRDFGVNPMFSDNLGLLLGGYPAIQLSILPRDEALYLAERYGKVNSDNPAGGRQGIKLPETWKASHGSNDSVGTLEYSAFLLMARILRNLAQYRFPLPRSAT